VSKADGKIDLKMLKGGRVYNTGVWVGSDHAAVLSTYGTLADKEVSGLVAAGVKFNRLDGGKLEVGPDVVTPDVDKIVAGCKGAPEVRNTHTYAMVKIACSTVEVLILVAQDGTPVFLSRVYEPLLAIKYMARSTPWLLYVCSSEDIAVAIAGTVTCTDADKPYYAALGKVLASKVWGVELGLVAI